MPLEMEEILQLAVDEKASDIHLTVGSPPVLRIHGSLVSLDHPPLTNNDTQRLMEAVSSDESRQKLRENGGTDFGFGFLDGSRFRVSIFKQKGDVGLVLRLIPSKLMTLDEIGLPSTIKELLFRPRGLILVTGPTGSGKTTTLASMLNIINHERDCHIITIEDPIEYYHKHQKSLVTQREVGVDVPSFREALIRGLRQDPDVILVGEMRDLETMQAAITAAETGHLVFATLHTAGAVRTVDRIIDAFPMDQQQQVRTQLASGLIAVISQLLLPNPDKNGRVAAFEIMITTPAIQAHIRDKKTFQILSEIQTGTKYGMQSLDAHLMSLYENNLILYDDLITKAQDPDEMARKLQENASKKKR